jgi:hypothetical protein
MQIKKTGDLRVLKRSIHVLYILRVLRFDVDEKILASG